jgi:type I restriction enzyme, S subunit
MDNWVFKTLGEVCNITTGKLNANAAVEDGEYPFFTCSREVFSIDNFAFDCEAILLAGNNAVGDFNVKHYNGKFNAYQRTYVITIATKEMLLYRYLYLQVENGLKEFKSKSVGSGTKFLKLDMIKGLNISIPPLPEQKQIVAIVDQAFEAIDVAIENTKQNLANARELFESYLNDIFTQRGEGWIEKKLEEICTITSKLVDPRQLEFIDLPHVGAGNMSYLTGELIDVKTAREEELISGKFIFDETMVLYSKIRPYLMKACRPDFKGLCSADVYPLLPNPELLNRDFLFHLLMSRKFTDYAIAGSDRAGMPKVNRDHLFRYITWIPCVSEQVSITKKINKLALESQRLEAIYRQKLAALTELKQSILQKAFTGELTADQENTP